MAAVLSGRLGNVGYHCGVLVKARGAVDCVGRLFAEATARILLEGPRGLY